MLTLQGPADGLPAPLSYAEAHRARDTLGVASTGPLSVASTWSRDGADTGRSSASSWKRWWLPSAWLGLSFGTYLNYGYGPMGQC